MYLLNDLAKMTHDEKLRAAARDPRRGRAYAAHRPANLGSPVRRLADLRILRGRRVVRAY
jgi:hypothetical protein